MPKPARRAPHGWAQARTGAPLSPLPDSLPSPKRTSRVTKTGPLTTRGPVSCLPATRAMTLVRDAARWCPQGARRAEGAVVEAIIFCAGRESVVREERASERGRGSRPRPTPSLSTSRLSRCVPPRAPTARPPALGPSLRRVAGCRHDGPVARRARLAPLRADSARETQAAVDRERRRPPPPTPPPSLARAPHLPHLAVKPDSWRSAWIARAAKKAHAPSVCACACNTQAAAARSLAEAAASLFSTHTRVASPLTSFFLPCARPS